MDEGGIMLDTSENYVENLVDKVLPKVITDAGTYKTDSIIRDGIISKLTAEQKAFVEATQKYLSEDMAEKGNQVSMALYGIRLFKEKNYFPLRVAKQGVYVSTELIDQNKLKNSGFTKEVTPDAKNAVVISDYSRVWTGHVKQMSDYHGMTLAMEDMDRVLNFGKTPELDEKGNIKQDEEGNPVYEAGADSVSATMQNIYSDRAENYIRDMMRQLNGGVRSDPAGDIISKGFRNFKKAQVAGSLSVWIQQWTSIFRAMAHIDFWHFVNKPVVGKARDAMVEEMKEHAGVAVIKEMGGYSTGMGSSLHDYITMAEPKGVKDNWKELKKHPLKRIDEATGYMPTRADENTWMRIWMAAKKETHKVHPELKGGTDAFYAAVEERFTEVITLTQVYDSTLSKSAMMRSSNGWAQMATQFASEPTMVLNMVVDAGVQYKRTGKIQKETMFAITASIVVNALCSSLIYAMRDDDEEETFIEKYMATLTENLIDGFNPLTYMPIIRDIWSVFQGYDVKRSDMSLWADMADSVETIVRLANDPDASDKKRADAWWELADGMFNLTGLPVRNIRREISACKNLFMTLEKDNTVRDTTMQSLGDATKEAALSSIPLMRMLAGETKAEKLVDALIAGDARYADRLRGSYKTKEAADNAIVGVIKERFVEGKLTEAQALDQIAEYTGKDGETYIVKWKFAIENPDSGLDASRVPKYVEFAEPAGIDAEVYAEYCEKKTGYSKKGDILRIINGMPLTRSQKDALYFAEGYAESTLDEAPWR